MQRPGRAQIAIEYLNDLSDALTQYDGVHFFESMPNDLLLLIGQQTLSVKL